MSDATNATPPGDGSPILRAQEEGRWVELLAMAATRAAWGPRETQAIVAAAVALADAAAVRRAAARAIAADLPAQMRAGCALILGRGGWAEEGLAVLVADPTALRHRASLPALMHLAAAPGLPPPLRSLARSLLRHAPPKIAETQPPVARRAPAGPP